LDVPSGVSFAGMFNEDPLFDKWQIAHGSAVLPALGARPAAGRSSVFPAALGPAPVIPSLQRTLGAPRTPEANPANQFRPRGL